MVTRVGVHEAKTRLSEYLNRAAYRGERILVERHGKPVAALVSVEDLRRLEEPQGTAVREADEGARQAAFRRAMEDAGAILEWPSGDPVPRDEYAPIAVEGRPLSEQIITDRR